MMRAMLSGVSGLKVHQQKMDVIGNNIANINTTAFKASRVTFSDIFSQTLSSATGADSASGKAGSNAKQVGLGVQIASIDTVMSRGSTETTGNSTDLAINGNGFFIVRSGNSGSYMFTRAGNFSIDENGNLTSSNGMNVYGWQDYTKTADGNYEFDTDKNVEAINLYSDSTNGNKQILAAKATESAVFTGSLDSSEDTGSTTAQYTTSMTVYDSLGNTHKLKVGFLKSSVTTGTDPTTTWEYTVTDPDDTTGAALYTGSLTFDSSGKLTTDYTSTPSITYTPDSSSGAAAMNITLDFSDLTTTSGDSSVATSDVDGYASGTLEDISIDANGIIMGVYSNGKQQALAQLGLAQFDNAAGLQSVGSNYFETTNNSGDFTNGVVANGTLSSGSLEMSNVDLSSEFSQMIITQRGYQANSRIITTADEMLQTILDMKR